jgi:hypothetical protein
MKEKKYLTNSQKCVKVLISRQVSIKPFIFVLWKEEKSI